MLARHLVRGGAGAAGIGENVHIREIAFADKCQTFGKFLLRLPWEGHDHVGSHGAFREIFPQQFHALVIPGGIVFPLHPLKNRVAAGLHRQVELGAQVGKCAQAAAEFLRHHSRLQGTQPHPQLRHSLTDFLNQHRHLRLARQVSAPTGDLDAGEDNLPVAPVRQFLRLRHRQLQRGGTDGAPGVGDDAVGAEVDAAVLHLQHGPCAFFQASRGQALKFPPAQSVVHLLPVGVGPGGIQKHLHKFLPVSAAADDIDAQRPDGLRVVLGIAAAHRDHCARVLPAAPADHGPVLFVRDGGDGAGVDDVGIVLFLKGADLAARLFQQLLHGLGLVLIGLAAQGIKRNPHIVNIAKYSGVSL